MSEWTDMLIREIWAKIEAWLADSRTDYGVNGPASAATIEQFLRDPHTGVPAASLESLRRHNGQRFNAPAFLGRHALLSIEDTIRVRANLRRIARIVAADIGPSDIKVEVGIRPMWWNEKWIPFAQAETRDQLMLDLDPGPHGNFGQVIQYWGDDARRTIVAPSYEIWLSTHADRLRQRNTVQR